MKKILLSESEKKAIISNRDKLIIENFAKTFNSIKRIDEESVNISQSNVQDWDNLYNWLKVFSTDNMDYLSSKYIRSGGDLNKAFMSGRITKDILDQIAKSTDGQVASQLPIMQKMGESNPSGGVKESYDRDPLNSYSGELEDLIESWAEYSSNYVENNDEDGMYASFDLTIPSNVIAKDEYVKEYINSEYKDVDQNGTNTIEDFLEYWKGTYHPSIEILAIDNGVVHAYCEFKYISDVDSYDSYQSGLEDSHEDDYLTRGNYYDNDND